MNSHIFFHFSYHLSLTCHYRYYLGELRVKVSEIGAEVARLLAEREQRERDAAESVCSFFLPFSPFFDLFSPFLTFFFFFLTLFHCIAMMMCKKTAHDAIELRLYFIYFIIKKQVRRPGEACWRPWRGGCRAPRAAQGPQPDG
jgi:hypothetical protein